MEEDPEIVNAPLHDESDPCEAEHSDSEPSSEEEDDWNTKKSLESIKDALRNDKILDLGDPSQEQQFLGRYGSFLGETTSDNDRNTLLHLIVEDAKDKVFGKYEPLVRLLISRHPGLAVVKDGNEKTALYIAISRKRDKLAHFICDNHPNVDQILNVPCYHSQNCLHLAVHRNIKLAGFLIERASEETLCAKDDQGRTPLHLAVDYTRCTVKQLEVVKALIQRGDKALDERTNAPHCLSAYRYHEHTHKDTERDEKSKEKDKSKWMEVKDEGGVHRKPEAAHKEDAGMKLIPPPQAGDARNVKPPSMVTRPPGNAPFDLETRKIDPPRRTNSILKPPGQPSGPSSSSGALKSSGGIKAMSNVESLVGNGKLGTIKKTRKKREKVESEVTKESADDVMSYLKLHCLRTRSHDAASDFLYGPNPENQIYFDLYDYNALTIREDHLKRSLDYLKLEDTLQYVFLANIKIEKPTPHKQGRYAHRPDGNGRNDMVAIFNFLRQKGVKRVLSVLVDDMDVPAHSDESIEHALEGLKVEVWNWRKFDLCVETIRVAAPEAREVHLYWSGNNTVLNGWSAPGGLDLLKDLKQVHLHVNQGSETARRTRNNVRQFEARLKRNRPGIIFDEPEEYQPEKYETQNAPTNSSVDLDKNRHRWLECMDEFADFIQNVEPPRQLYEPITIALIDDGVDINELSLHDKIVGGRSFSQRKGFLNASRPYYVTNGGHGTVMGSLICRVCPRAKLFILKLDEYISDQSRRQITASSAAKAVRAAIERKVHIISMSWTIERTKHNVKDIADLEAAIEAAAKAGILMFCAANDQGISRDESFPSACGGTKHLFKIGAAEASGVAWKWVQMTDVDFIFPGHNVVKDRPKDAPLDKCRTLTGSSVATAIAAGLSALVLYCIQVGAINMEDSSQQQGQKYNAIKRKDYEDIKAYDRMKEAFLAIGTSQDSGNKYIEVWHTFENAPKKAVGAEKEKRLEIITELAERLKTRKTFE